MAILAFLFRFRVALFAVLAVATAGAAWLAFHDLAVPVGALFLSAASLAAGGIVAFAYLRHAALAALSVLAPLPGMIAAGPFALAGGTAVSGLLAVYGFGVVIAACLAGGLLRRMLDSSEPDAAAGAVLARCAVPLALCLVAGVALLAGWLFRDARALGLGNAGVFAAAMLSAGVVVPFAAASLRFGEAFIVIANRARERRETLLRILTQVVEPRWGLAFSGAAVTLAALGWFGAAPLLAHSALLAQPALWAASALLVFLFAFAAGRDWRDALAATLALAALTLLGLYLCGRAAGRLSAASLVEIAVTAATALFLMMDLIVRGRRYRQSGEASAVARLRAIEDCGLAPWFGTLGAAAAVLPWVLVHGSIVTLAVLFPLACAAAVVGMPALATALETLLPRRRSVNELYGRG
ncbi:MAG: hypothetical protein WDN08_17545 [Rhizomicrobium sp.]